MDIGCCSNGKCFECRILNPILFSIIIILTGLILFMAIVKDASAQEIDPIPVLKIVDAIWMVEGADKTRFPYGIKSVKCSGREECRKIAYNTVRNNWRRWEAAGRPGEYIDFLADRYCPPSVDPAGNRNWKSNMKRILK